MKSRVALLKTMDALLSSLDKEIESLLEKEAAPEGIVAAKIARLEKVPALVRGQLFEVSRADLLHAEDSFFWHMLASDNWQPGAKCVIETFKFLQLPCHGTHSLSDGSIYTGAFKDGAYEGQGTYYHTISVNRGEFKGDPLEGQGTLPGHLSQRIYSGGWKSGLFDCHGICSYGDGGSFSGEYRQGKREGLPVGKFISSTGLVAIGMYQEDQLNGMADLTRSGGTHLAGNSEIT